MQALAAIVFGLLNLVGFGLILYTQFFGRSLANYTTLLTAGCVILAVGCIGFGIALWRAWRLRRAAIATEQTYLAARAQSAKR